MRDDLDRCREAGMDEFVAKPVTLAALAGAIEHSVKLSRAAAGLAAGDSRSGATGPGGSAAPGSADAGSAAAWSEPGGTAAAGSVGGGTAAGGAAAEGTAGEGTAAEEPGAEASAAESGRASAAIDRPVLDSLRDDLGGADALLRIVRLFLEQLDPQAEQIERDARGGELETLARNAHRMKSSAATLGATELAELLRQLEATAVEGDAAACDQLATSFGAAVLAAREAFGALLEELDVEVAAGG